jgi:hypothetical protein
MPDFRHSSSARIFSPWFAASAYAAPLGTGRRGHIGAPEFSKNPGLTHPFWDGE